MSMKLFSIAMTILFVGFAALVVALNHSKIDAAYQRGLVECDSNRTQYSPEAVAYLHNTVFAQQDTIAMLRAVNDTLECYRRTVAWAIPAWKVTFEVRDFRCDDTLVIDLTARTREQNVGKSAITLEELRSINPNAVLLKGR
jgi:hypothetical protein